MSEEKGPNNEELSGNEEDKVAEPRPKGVLPTFVESVAQQMVDGKTPIALIAVFDQEGVTSSTKFIHRDGNMSTLHGELARIGIEALVTPKNITS